MWLSIGMGQALVDTVIKLVKKDSAACSLQYFTLTLWTEMVQLLGEGAIMWTLENKAFI
jgi:hypothetical protein